MRRIRVFLTLLAVCSVVPVTMLAKLPDRGISASAEARQEFPAVVELAQRVVPWLAPDLLTRRIPRDQGHDVFEISTAAGKLIVGASDVPSAAEGLNWYLNYYCHRSISHLGDNIAPVEPLPQIPQPVRHTARFGTRYYLNYTTFNYTFSFADWKRWEHELDWMALNGVNLTLAAIGTEAVWQNTLRRVGYSESEVLAFLPGPAYTAWWLMGNLEGWGGPVTESMIDERVELQRKILARMRELGIEPVLQGFYGMVPASLAQKFPQANIVDQGEWGIEIGYDPAKIEEAARDFLSAKERLGGVDTYQIDAVDLVRQVLSNRGLLAYGQMATAYQARDKTGFDQSSKVFVDLLRDENRLLATRHEFLLGNWLEAAEKMGKNELERTICQRNARTQITYWGPDNPGTELHDYAHKEWSGLLHDFYLERWQMFAREFSAQLDGKPAEQPNYFEFEKGWTERRNTYPVEPTGDSVSTAAAMLSGGVN